MVVGSSPTVGAFGSCRLEAKHCIHADAKESAFLESPPRRGEEKSSSTSLSPPLLLLPLLLLPPPPPPLLLFSLFVSSCSQTAAEGLPRMNAPCTRGAKRHQWNAQASSSSERNSTSQSRLSAIERGRRGLRRAIAPSVRVQMLK